MSVKNAAKAIVVNDDKILLNKCKNSLGDMIWDLADGDIYYDLPGGGQKRDETLGETVVRECLEETGLHIVVERFAAIYEEILINEKFKERFGFYSHKIYFIFIARLTGELHGEIAESDFVMIGSEWVGLDEIDNVPLYPVAVKKNLRKIIGSNEILFLGSEKSK